MPITRIGLSYAIMRRHDSLKALLRINDEDNSQVLGAGCSSSVRSKVYTAA